MKRMRICLQKKCESLMAGRAWHGPEGLNQRGSILAEFLVVASAVLVPLAILMPILFKYIENRQYVEQAARYAAWERTAYYLSAPDHLPSSTPVKGAAAIQREVDNRILADGRAPIRREQRNTDHEEELNPNLTYWDRSNHFMEALYEPESGGGLEQWASVTIDNEGLGGQISEAITRFSTGLIEFGSSGFYLTNDGQYRSEVSLRLAEVDFFPELDAAPITMSRANTLVADGWTQGGPESAASAARSLNILGKWGDGKLTDVLNLAAGILSYIPLMGAIGDLDLGKVEVDAVPCVNLGQMNSDGTVTPATRCH